jgi:tetratricopeptide (TPR) repeat protein
LVVAEHGGWKDPESDLKKKVQLMDKLLQEMPISSDDRAAFALAYDGFCYSLRTAGRFKEAAECGRQAVRLREQALTSTPDNVHRRAHLAWSMMELGCALFGLRSCAEAERTLTNAVPIWEKVLAELPASDEYRWPYAITLVTLADVLKDKGNPKGAVEVYGRAIKVCEELGQKSPANTSYKDRAEYCRSQLDELKKALKQKPESVKR